MRRSQRGKKIMSELTVENIFNLYEMNMLELHDSETLSKMVKIIIRSGSENFEYKKLVLAKILHINGVRNRTVIEQSDSRAV